MKKMNIASRCQDMTSVDTTPSGLGCYASNPDDRPVNLRKPREEVVRRSSKAGDEYTTVVFPLQIEAGSIESWGYLACDDERTEEGPIQVGKTQEGQLVIKEVYQGPMPSSGQAEFLKERLAHLKWIEARPTYVAHPEWMSLFNKNK